MRVIKILMILILFSACKTNEPIVTSEKRIVKDSVSVVERIIPRDTLIVVPADSLKLTARIQDITEKEIVKTTNRLRLSLRREGDKIIADCHEGELLLKIALLEKEIEIRRELHTELQTTINTFVSYVPKVVKWLAWVGGIFILLVGIGVILRVKKVI